MPHQERLAAAELKRQQSLDAHKLRVASASLRREGAVHKLQVGQARAEGGGALVSPRGLLSNLPWTMDGVGVGGGGLRS